MENIGKVLEIKDNIAKVEVRRESACGGNCASCGGCDVKAVCSDVNNDIGANVGDVVKVELATAKVMLAAMAVYIVPLLLLILATAYIGFIYGVVFIVILFIILKEIDKNLVGKFSGRITEIIDRAEQK